MNIYLDESGSFIVSGSKESRISCVVALVIPGKKINAVLEGFKEIRVSWGRDTDEIKGSKLNEKEINEVIEFLSEFDLIADICCIDSGMHSTNQIEKFRKTQADKIVESLTPEHQPSMIAELREYSKMTYKLSNQLLVQTTVTIQLIKRLIEGATLYYSLHIPEELSSFTWIVDAKDKTRTNYERIWSTLVAPFLSASTNLPMIKEGDYSHFQKFLKPLASTTPPKQVVPPPPNPIGYVDVGLLMRDITFKNSREDTGIQLADIIAAAFSRAMNGNLAKEGWVNLGSIFLDRGPRTIHMITLQNEHTSLPSDFRNEVIREINRKAKTLCK